MIIETRIPPFPLNQFIEYFVYYKGYTPEHSVDRFLPDAYTYVVIDLTDQPKFIYDNYTLKEIQCCKNVWFSGIREKFITIPSGRDNEMFIIYFQKGKAYPFVDMPMSELTDCVVDGELVMSNNILNMRNILRDLPTTQQKFEYVEQYLSTAYANKLIANPFVDYAVNLMMQNPHQLSIRLLAEKVGYSQKHLISIFNEHVGLTPKAFLKIIRFQKAVQEIEAGCFIDWTHIALDSGYYDQAHFINDFKEFSGFTPKQFLKTKREFTNYIAIE